ncbi:MAG: hypothetical protein JWL76_2171 [Thermoleophilia bacterium]|nr:hypothetical protein [Thermoleophilia bacterium]
MSRALVRPARPSRLVAAFVGVLASVALVASGTGFGATDSTQLPSANVVGTLALTDPAAKSADPPVCTDAAAPLDTDNCGDVTFSGTGSGKVLKLGSLSGSDVQAGSLRWTVTTTNVTGYRVHMSNVGAAPLLRSAGSTIADMSTGPLVAASAVDDATHFGVAMGDPAADNEGAVSYTGSPWVTGGQQGELFSGIPTSGMVVAERTSAQTADPFTATFAAASVASAQPAPGSYAGTVRVVASAL